MHVRIYAFILLCSGVCAAQSTLTTPLSTASQVEQENSDRTPDARPVGRPGLNPQTEGLREPTQPEGIRELTQPAVPTGLNGIRPLTTKSEFQRFAEDAAGHPLRVYGRDLFDQVPTTFAPVDNVPVPADYVIGPGDELMIRIWGKITLDARPIVDRNGQVLVPKVGTLNVAGVTYGELESRIRSAVSGLYRDFELNVTLGRLRSIQVYVLGSARRPGVYTVSSLSTLVNALFASGGPSATGSMRSIQLRRGRQTITEFDLYDLLKNGDRTHDVQLLPGDVIYIPPVGPQVAVLGSVNEPGIYELKPDASVDLALHAAGGLTALAGTERLLLERIEDHKSRRVDEFALDTAGLERSVRDGDLLRVFPVSPQFENSITLRGNVAVPGRYVWRDGMRVSDLIPTRESLVTRDFWNQQNHLFTAESPNPFGARANNRVRDQIHHQSEMEREFSSEGLPSQSAGQSRDEQANSSDWDQTTLSNAQHDEEDTATISSIGKNSAEMNWDYAVIERLDEHDLSTHLIPFRLAAAIDDHASPDNQLLRPGDVITIFSRADLELPMEKHASFVRVGGEVNAPGVYRVNPGDTLQDVVRRAGGLSSHSYLYASRFTRVSARRAEEEQLRQSSEKMEKELTSRYANATPGASQGAPEQQAQMAMQEAVIARLTAVKPTGRVVLQMKPTAGAIDDIPELPLEDGDTFYVPPRLSTVQVAGSVYNANAFRYQDGKNVSAYLSDAGGPTREADKRRAFVIRADGTVISKQSKNSHFHERFENLKLLPGDSIVVPERLRTPGARGLQDFVQIMSESAITSAALSNVLR